MADIAASVLARLKNKAAESGRSYQPCLQLFCRDDYGTVLNTIKVFLTAPFVSAIESTKYTKQRSASSCKWT